MTRATSVIDDCINKLKIRGKHKEKWAKTRKKGTRRKKSGPALAVLPDRRRRPWYSPWCPFSKLHKWFRSTEQEGRQSSKKKSFKRHLLLNHCSKFHKTSHECSLWYLAEKPYIFLWLGRDPLSPPLDPHMFMYLSIYINPFIRNCVKVHPWNKHTR